jgi:hypothetical protein
MTHSLQEYIQNSEYAFTIQGDSSIFVKPHIPASKLAGVMSSYVNQTVVNPQDIIVLVDDTLFGGAREGFVLTEDMLYAKEPFSSAQCVQFKQIKTFTMGREFFSTCLFVNGTKVQALTQPSKESMMALCQVVNDYLKQRSPDSVKQKPKNKIKDDLNVFLTMVDILAHFALLKKQGWSSEQVQYIKESFASAELNTEQMARIRDRIKSRNRPSLEESIPAYLQQINHNEEARMLITYQVCGMLHVSGYSPTTLENHTERFGKQMRLDQHIIDNIIERCSDEFEDPEEEYDHSEYEDFSQNGQGHQQSQNHDTIAWACEILHIEQHNITQERVQQAYRVKIKEYHPDKFQSLPDAIKQLLNEKAQELNKAKEVLSQYCSG